MIAAIADTHAILWYLYDDKRLSRKAAEFMDQAITEGKEIGISSITVVEVVYLIEKATIPTDALDRITSGLLDKESLLTEVVLNRQLIPSMRNIARAAVPDMPDRIIAATAVHLDVPLISRDGKITVSGVKTIW